MTPIDVKTIVETYMAAWGEPDPTERQRLLALIWQTDGVYADPMTQASNRVELDKVIAHFLEHNPEARFTLEGEIDYHNHYVRFYWVLHLSNGVKIPGMDYGEVTAAGKLTKIVGFF
jgi:hypothetical protein